MVDRRSRSGLRYRPRAETARGNRVTLCFSDQELADLTAAASRAGLFVGAHIAVLAVQSATHPASTNPVAVAATTELRRIQPLLGRLADQLAARPCDPAEPAELGPMLTETRALMAAVDAWLRRHLAPHHPRRLA